MNNSTMNLVNIVTTAARHNQRKRNKGEREGERQREDCTKLAGKVREMEFIIIMCERRWRKWKRRRSKTNNCQDLNGNETCQYSIYTLVVTIWMRCRCEFEFVNMKMPCFFGDSRLWKACDRVSPTLSLPFNLLWFAFILSHSLL